MPVSAPRLALCSFGQATWQFARSLLFRDPTAMAVAIDGSGHPSVMIGNYGRGRIVFVSHQDVS